MQKIIIGLLFSWTCFHIQTAKCLDTGLQYQKFSLLLIYWSSDNWTPTQINFCHASEDIRLPLSISKAKTHAKHRNNWYWYRDSCLSTKGRQRNTTLLFFFFFFIFFFFYKSVIFLLKSVHLLVEYIKYRYLIPASLTLVKHITYKDVSIC